MYVETAHVNTAQQKAHSAALNSCVLLCCNAILFMSMMFSLCGCMSGYEGRPIAEWSRSCGGHGLLPSSTAATLP